MFSCTEMWTNSSSLSQFMKLGRFENINIRGREIVPKVRLEMGLQRVPESSRRKEMKGQQATPNEGRRDTQDGKGETAGRLE